MNPIRAAMLLGAAVLFGVGPSAQALPPVTDGLVVWLSADAVNTGDTNQVRIVGPDTFVKQWNDGSGNAHHATNATDADQPKYIASGLNGKPVLRFTGINDDAGSELKLGDLSAYFPAAGSMFAVSTINSDGRYSLFDNRNNDSRWVANTWNESQPGVFVNGRKGMTYSSWPQTGSHVFAMESSSSIYRFVIDGTQIGSAGADYHNGSGQNWTIGDRPGNGQQLNGDIPEFILYNRVLTAAEANLVGAYLAQRYAVTTTYPALPIPPAPTGVAAAPVSSGAISVSWSPATAATSYNVWVRNTVTSVVQVFSAPASPFSVTGLTNGTSYEFKVSATNSSGTSAYSSMVSATPVVSAAKNILTFDFPGQPEVTFSGANISVTVPVTMDITALAPTYTVSPLATGSPASGTPRNFTSAQTYTVTAEDLSTQVYTVTVTKGAVPTIFTWTTAVAGNWSDFSKWTNDLANGARPVATGQTYYTLNFNQAGTYTSTNDRNAGFLLNKLNFGGGATLAGNSLAFSANGATLPQLNQNSSSGVTISAPLGLASDLTLGGSGSGSLSLSGVISGSGALTKNNTGALTLSAVNTYSGGTTINAGSINLANTANTYFGTGPVTVNSGATLNLNGNGNLANAFTFNGASVGNGNSFSAYISGPITMAATSSFDLFTTGQMGIGGNISGPGGLTKKGTSGGAFNLTGTNGFTGVVSVQAGVLQVASLNRVSGGTATSNLGAPTTVPNGTIALGATNTAGTLLYGGPGETTDRVIKLAGTTGGATLAQSGTNTGIPTTRGESGLLKFTSDVSIPGTAGVDNRKTLTLTHTDPLLNGPAAGRGELSGSIGDSVLGTAGQLATSVTKAGTGTWTLSGVSTYSGATKVQAGTLVFAKSNSLGSGSLDISTGAKAQLDYIGTRQISSLTFNAGAAQPNGTYGSTSSIATNKDDTRFSGLGTITIGTITALSTTTLARTAGTSPSNGGVTLTFTATVTGSAPTGSVVFYDGLTALGTVALNGSAQASLSTSTLTAAVHEMTAWYLGNGSNAPSASAALSQTIVETRPATTQTLTSGSNPSTFGASVTFTVNVAGTAPTGLVTFYDGAVVLGSSALNGSAQASLSISTLASGWHPITSRYVGDSNNAPSSVAAALFQTVNPPVGNGKVKVFILAGQSNMVGKGRVETGRDPNNLGDINFPGGNGSLRNMLNKNPNKYGYLADPAHPIAGGSPGWITRSDVWVTYWGESNVENRRGNLDADFGDYGAQGRIGPEYGFGLVAGSQLADQVLLIKYAFGGKSLAVDFRPPSSGGTVGPYYTGMLARVNQVLTNLSTFFPAYTGGGYEIVGVGWHQGYNDRINAGYAAEYEVNMTNFIKDVRTALGVPNLPFSIGNTGMAVANSDAGALAVIAAQAAVANPALHPEFAGTVSTVETRPFDNGELLGGSSEGYHWYWSAESYFNIGDSMGRAMMALLPPLSSAKNILTFDFPGQPATTISGTNISVTVPYGTSVTALAPTFTLSPLAAASPASGATGNFTTPQTYTVTAQDLTTQVYTVTVTVAPSPFSTWASNPAQGLTAGVNDGPLDDPDRDGIPNLLEFTLGGAPMASSQSILPKVTPSGNNWLFEYDRSDLSLSPATTQVVEYGSDLAGWTPVTIPTTTAGIVTITPGSPSDHVTVTIASPGAKCFVRLKVTQ